MPARSDYKNTPDLGDLLVGIPGQSHINSDGITMHEAGEIIRRIGEAKGYIPISEYKIDIGDKIRRRVDWVWMKKDLSGLVAAFEIEGNNVQDASLNLDIKKFNSLRGKYSSVLCFIVTYKVRFDQKNIEWITLPNTGIKKAKNKITYNPFISVLSDYEVKKLLQFKSN